MIRCVRNVHPRLQSSVCEGGVETTCENERDGVRSRPLARFEIVVVEILTAAVSAAARSCGTEDVGRLVVMHLRLLLEFRTAEVTQH